MVDEWRSQQFFVTKNGKKELIHIETDTKNIVDFYAGTTEIINKLRGAVNGIAALDEDGHVPQSQLNNIEQQLADLESKLNKIINNNKSLAATNLQNAIDELNESINKLSSTSDATYLKLVGGTLTGPIKYSERALWSEAYQGTKAAINFTDNTDKKLIAGAISYPTVNGRIVSSTFPSSDTGQGSEAYWLFYQTNDKTNTDSYSKCLSWRGDTGVLTCDKVVNAVYNDYAELFPKGEETEPGDLLVLDTNSDEEKYIKSSKNNKHVVGVHSDEYGHLIGGDNVSLEENLKNYVPVGLAGRIRVKFIGIAKKNEYVVASDISGVAKLYEKGIDSPEDIIGILVEQDDKSDKIRRLKIKIK